VHCGQVTSVTFAPSINARKGRAALYYLHAVGAGSAYAIFLPVGVGIVRFGRTYYLRESAQVDQVCLLFCW
jgi:hypothetical protein